MSEHHDKFPPSAFPAWAVCPCYEPSPDSSADADAGTVQHAAVVERMRGGDCPTYTGLNAGEQSAVDWCVDWLRAHTNAPLFEERVEILDDDWNILTFGTVDVLQPEPLMIVDFKFGNRRDYFGQLAAYALGACQRYGHRVCQVFILYGRHRHVEERTITVSEAEAVVRDIIARRSDPEHQPVVCEFCSFCAENGRCPAQVEKAVEIATGRGESVPVMSYHPSQVSDPRVMANLLGLATSMAAFADSVKHHARKMAVDGTPIPGWELKERRGRAKVSDVNEVYNRLGLQPEAFIGACDVSLPRLADAYGAVHNMSKSTARRHIEKELNGVLDHGAPVQYLSKVGEESNASD